MRAGNPTQEKSKQKPVSNRAINPYREECCRSRQSRAEPSKVGISPSRRRLVFRGRRRHLSRHVYVRGNHGNAVERGLETRPPLISPSCRSVVSRRLPIKDGPESVAVAGRHCGGVRRVLLRLRLPRCLHRDAQSVAGRDDQARCCPLQLADRQMGMGRAAERTEDVESGVRREGLR